MSCSDFYSYQKMPFLTKEICMVLPVKELLEKKVEYETYINRFEYSSVWLSCMKAKENLTLIYDEIERRISINKERKHER